MAPLPLLLAAFLYVAFGAVASAVPALHPGTTAFLLGVIIAYITNSSSSSADMLVASVTLWLTSSSGVTSMLLIPPLIHARLLALASPAARPLSVSTSVACRACSALTSTTHTRSLNPCCKEFHSSSGTANFAASCAALAAMLRSFNVDWSWQQSVAVAAALSAGNRQAHPSPPFPPCAPPASFSSAAAFSPAAFRGPPLRPSSTCPHPAPAPFPSSVSSVATPSSPPP